MDTQKLLEERAKSHGDFSEHARMAQLLKERMREGVHYKQLTHAQVEALEMIQHKIARILSGHPNFRDHWDDIAGYAKLAADRCQPAVDPVAILQGMANGR